MEDTLEILSEKIYEVIKDYHCDYSESKYELNQAHIQKWAKQFGDDAKFILTELLHFLPEIYISKEKAKKLLKNRLLEIQKKYGYKTMNEFIINTYFFDVQKPDKSQKELLIIIDEILQTEFFIDYKDLEKNTKKHFIYFDDILASGGTIMRDLDVWLNENQKDNTKQVINKTKTLDVSLFCGHTLGYANFEYALMKRSDDKIKSVLNVYVDYVIENNLKTKFQANSQRLNCAYPIDDNSPLVNDYLNSLKADNTSIPAFRDKSQPSKETFFSSPDNRIKMEKIFLEKGIELLSKIKKDSPDLRKRPLGDTVKSHKTLGIGTLFFTWRNISNTCPLVFWWDVPTHDWTPLFCVKNRG